MDAFILIFSWKTSNLSMLASALLSFYQVTYGRDSVFSPFQKLNIYCVVLNMDDHIVSCGFNYCFFNNSIFSMTQ